MNAITIYKKRSLAVVPFPRLKIKIRLDILRAQLAIWELIWNFKYLESPTSYAIEAMDEFSFITSWQMIDYKRKHPILFRLRRILGIY